MIQMEVVRSILKDVVANTTCDIDVLKEFAMDLRKYELLTMSDKTVISNVTRFIYEHKGQDSIINFIYETYVSCLCYSVDKYKLAELSLSTIEFLNSESLDKEYADVLLENFVPEKEGSNIFLNVIRFLRCYVSILEDCIVVRFNREK